MSPIRSGSTSPSEGIAAAGYSAAWRMAHLPPRGLLGAGLNGLTTMASRGPAVGQLRANLARFRPGATELELDELALAGLRSYARYWAETFRLPRADHAAVADGFAAGLHGAHHLRDALRRGNGAVVALPHMGNWDVAGLWVCRTFGGLTTVVERLEPPRLFERFLAYRQTLGFDIVPLTGAQLPVLRLRRALAQNQVVCLVADRDLAGDGPLVSFAGAPARLPAGPAALAAASGAALLPVGLWFTDDGGWNGIIHEPVATSGGARGGREHGRGEAIERATQRLADIFTTDIRYRPQDWHMMQPLWTERTDRPRAWGGRQ